MDTTIEDVNGVEMKAFDIFTAAIKYLKEQMLAQLQRSLKGTTIKDVHFVLTVPAIWEDHSKMFMRRAAEEVIVHINSTYYREIIYQIKIVWYVIQISMNCGQISQWNMEIHILDNI